MNRRKINEKIILLKFQSNKYSCHVTTTLKRLQKICHAKAKLIDGKVNANHAHAYYILVEIETFSGNIVDRGTFQTA